MNYSKTIMRCLMGIVLAIASTYGHAVPILYFDGSSDYDATSGLLTINAGLTGTDGIAPPPTLAGSSLSIQASFVSASSVDSITTGWFDSAPGSPDLSIIDGGATTLLEGEILDLLIKGPNGLDFGVLAANFTPTAGSLLGDFTDPSGIFALELNLTSVFSPAMFESDFSGQTDGRVTTGAAIPPSEIPEPGIFALLALSLGLVVMGRKYAVNKS